MQPSSTSTILRERVTTKLQGGIVLVFQVKIRRWTMMKPFPTTALMEACFSQIFQFPRLPRDQELDSSRLDLTQNSSQKAHDNHWIKKLPKKFAVPKLRLYHTFCWSSISQKLDDSHDFSRRAPDWFQLAFWMGVCNVAILLVVETKSWY